MSNRSMFFFRTTGTYSGNFNQGPLTVNPVGKLLKVQAAGSLFAGLSSIANTAEADNPFAWGVQYGPHGFTPLDLVTGGNSSTWLRNSQIEYENVTQLFDSTISTVDYANWQSIRFTWWGQLPINADTDFYLTFKVPLAGSGPAAAVSGTLEVLYT
jgi:hypothetical protein